MSRFQEKQLGQSRPAGTAAASIYSPPANTTTIIKTIIVSNVSSASMKYSIFMDDNGTTYDQTTAIAYNVVLAKESTIVIDTFLAMNDATGNIAFQVDTADSATISIFGAEMT